MFALVRKIFAREKFPLVFFGLTLAAFVIQLNLGWRDLLLYERGAIVRGEWYRLWTGHFVHFGWPHFVADVGLFLILGRLLEWEYPALTRVALVSMPAVISAAIFFFDPGMQRYGGLSAVNLGWLVFLAGRGWQKDWTDWFWPAVLVIYVGEIILEVTQGHGQGGGMIRFDDPTVHVATRAHVVSAICGGVMIALVPRRRPATTESERPRRPGIGRP